MNWWFRFFDVTSRLLKLDGCRQIPIILDYFLDTVTRTKVSLTLVAFSYSNTNHNSSNKPLLLSKDIQTRWSHLQKQHIFFGILPFIVQYCHSSELVKVGTPLDGIFKTKKFLRFSEFLKIPSNGGPPFTNSLL